jgi:ferredoxin
MAVKIDKNKCIACGACVKVCPVDAITIKETAVVDEETCIECGACINECPVEAIEL